MLLSGPAGRGLPVRGPSIRVMPALRHWQLHPRIQGHERLETQHVIGIRPSPHIGHASAPVTWPPPGRAAAQCPAAPGRGRRCRPTRIRALVKKRADCHTQVRFHSMILHLYITGMEKFRLGLTQAVPSSTVRAWPGATQGRKSSVALGRLRRVYRRDTESVYRYFELADRLGCWADSESTRPGRDYMVRQQRTT
jgi:hypothetical protein